MTEGSGHVRRAAICSRWTPRFARRKESSSRSSIPVEIPGVTNAYFLRSAYNEIRKAKGLEELDPLEFLDLMEEKMKLVDMDPAMLNRSVNTGFSGGEKKRNEILQMAVLVAASRDSRRDRFGTRHRCAANRRRWSEHASHVLTTQRSSSRTISVCSTTSFPTTCTCS